MAITLNHTIVPARGKRAAAQFFARIFGLHAGGSSRGPCATREPPCSPRPSPLGGAPTGFAADLSLKPVYKPAPIAPAVATYNWTGFYIGGNVGYGWSHRDFTNTITGTSGSTQLAASKSGIDEPVCRAVCLEQLRA